MSGAPDQGPGDVWWTGPVTLWDVVLDREAMEARLTMCPALERVWILGLLDRTQEAIAEGQELLDALPDRLRPLLVIAQAYQRQYSWHDAARLQEEALRLACTRAREALVRHQIGRRLFDEARYREAAAEFEWARDLYRSTGQREHLVQACHWALERARELSGTKSRAACRPRRLWRIRKPAKAEISFTRQGALGRLWPVLAAAWGQEAWLPTRWNLGR